MSLESEFTNHFGAPPERVVRAPGRVNLIGEHTDYNGGFVLPMAIDREARIAARRRPDRRVRMVALDFGGAVSEFSLDAIEHVAEQTWSNYVRGVALFLQERGANLSGLDLVIQSNVPIGSGLSSSAALEVCAATTFQAFGGFSISQVETAQLCQKVENEFLGVQTGIMDQFISALAKAGHALLIDCRDLSYQHVPMPQGATVVVCDTTKRRGLVTSKYNTRRAECEEAARLMGVALLRDVSPTDLGRFETDMPPTVAKRARHVVAENARVLEAVAAMKQNNLPTFGTLMNQSHESLRNDYEVSCPELDTMVEIARQQPGCLGARLTGAGFGGCTVNLVADEHVAAFVANVAREYEARTGIRPPVYVCRPSAGASVAW
ncbi:MAG: galactokinase [Chloroflexi bacterium]|nr:galactokinase [Chloroflexota bacterium]